MSILGSTSSLRSTSSYNLSPSQDLYWSLIIIQIYIPILTTPPILMFHYISIFYILWLLYIFHLFIIPSSYINSLLPLLFTISIITCSYPQIISSVPLPLIILSLSSVLLLIPLVILPSSRSKASTNYFTRISPFLFII